jgi:hypothetical protein
LGNKDLQSLVVTAPAIEVETEQATFKLPLDVSIVRWRSSPVRPRWKHPGT